MPAPVGSRTVPVSSAEATWASAGRDRTVIRATRSGNLDMDELLVVRAKNPQLIVQTSYLLRERPGKALRRPSLDFDSFEDALLSGDADDHEFQAWAGPLEGVDLVQQHGDRIAFSNRDR